MLRSLLLTLLLAPAFASGATQTLNLPLDIPYGFVERIAADALGLDSDGYALLAADSCNRLELSEPGLGDQNGQLTLELAVRAHSGAPVFGRCTGPRPVDGRLQIQLRPELASDRLGVKFSAVRMEWLSADGRPGLLSTPSRVLADHLVLPRLDRMLIDLGAGLLALDQTLEDFLPDRDDEGSRLAERSVIEQVGIEPDGLRLDLRLSVFALAPGLPEPVLDAVELREWQTLEDELDGFLTVIVASLAASADQRDIQLDLLAALIEGRLRIAEALAVDSDDETADPVRVLFLGTWNSLQPALASLAKQTDSGLELLTFISAGNALRALDALGPDYGLEISRDGLRRLARLLLADDAPLAFTPLPLDIDPQLQALFGLGLAEPAPPPAVITALRRLGEWFVPSAHADPPSPGDALRGLVPRLSFLDDYLVLVDRLLQYKVDARRDDDIRVPEEFLDLFDPLVRATAWKESCWRHYVGSPDEPQVIRSPVGAVGMMQIMGRVWRSIYDIERLEAEVEYNVAAGIEILEHYLVDYALRRGEHEQPGGRDNLVRATYAAYNGGPSHLTRYRREDTPPRLRAIDQAFWRDFEQMRAEQWPDVAGCYSVN